VSVVGAYTLHLYCDSGKHQAWETNQPWFDEADYYIGGHGEYIGTSYTGCVRSAKKNGWIISKDKQRCVCPNCNKKSRHYKETP
jgi:hypothetical protein